MRKILAISFSIFGTVLLSSCSSSISFDINLPSKGNAIQRISMKDKDGNICELSNEDDSKSIYRFIYDNYNYFDIDHCKYHGSIKRNGETVQLNCLRQDYYIYSIGDCDGKPIEYKIYDKGLDIEVYSCYFKNGAPLYGGAHFEGASYALEAGALPPIASDPNGEDSYMGLAHSVVYFDENYHITRLPMLNKKLKFQYFINGKDKEFDFSDMVDFSVDLFEKYIVIDISYPLLLISPFIVSENNLFYDQCAKMEEEPTVAKSIYYINCETGKTDYISFSYEGYDIYSSPAERCEFKYEFLSEKVNVSRDAEAFKKLMRNCVVR